MLSPELSQHLRGMAGFRNLVVHRCHELSLLVLRSVIDACLVDLIAFAAVAQALSER